MFGYSDPVVFVKNGQILTGRIYDDYEENGIPWYTIMEDAKPPVDGWQTIPGLYDLPETCIFRTIDEAEAYLERNEVTA